MIAFELEADAYWPIREAATSLSKEVTVAIRSATGVSWTTRHRARAAVLSKRRLGTGSGITPEGTWRWRAIRIRPQRASGLLRPSSPR